MKKTAGLKSPALTIDKAKSQDQAESNYLYINPALFKEFLSANKEVEPVYGQLNDFVFILKPDSNVAEGYVAISGSIRNCLKLTPALDRPIITWYDLPKELFMLSNVKMTVTTPTLRADQKEEISEEEMIKYFSAKFKGHFIGTGQEFYGKIKVGLSDKEC